MVMPGQTPGGPPRGQHTSEVPEASTQALDESIDNLYSSKRVPESDEVELYGPASRRSSARKRSTGPSRPVSSAADTVEAIRRTLPPLTPEDEVEVGLSSDRAPALLEEGGVLSSELRVPSFPMPPSFESNVFSADQIIEDEEVEGYDTEEAEAFNALDGPSYATQHQEGLVHARRSWVPVRPRRSMRPTSNAVAEPAQPVAVGRREPTTPEPGYRPLATASIAAIVLSIIAAVSRPIPIPSTASIRFSVGRVLTDNPFQQSTGYLLVLLSIFSLALSLRKHWKRFQLFDFAFFRVIHVILGTATLVVLAMHTGLRLGRGLEFALAVDFLAVCVLGGMAGVVTAVSHRWDGVAARDRRMASTRLHLAAFWPLPVLIALHIYQVYYY